MKKHISFQNVIGQNHKNGTSSFSIQNHRSFPAVILCICLCAFGVFSVYGVEEAAVSELPPKNAWNVAPVGAAETFHNLLDEWGAWLPVGRPIDGDISIYWKKKIIARSAGRDAEYAYVHPFELLGAEVRLSFEFLESSRKDARVSFAFAGVTTKDGKDLVVRTSLNDSIVLNLNLQLFESGNQSLKFSNMKSFIIERLNNLDARQFIKQK